jgi:MFS family permease
MEVSYQVCESWRALPHRASPIRRSLSISTVEGILAEVVNSCSTGANSFTAASSLTASLTAWCLALKLSPLWLGMLAALPFFAQFLQFPAAWVTSLLGHRRAAIVTITLSRQVLWPLVVLPFLPLSPGGKQAVFATVGAIAVFFAVLGNNAWTAWMAELVPTPLRGRYFGRRTALYTVATAVAALFSGWVLDLAGRHGRTSWALSGLALVACLAGTVTTVLLLAQADPRPGDGAVPELRAALKPFQESASRRVLAFQVMWNGAVGLTSAFFSLHMLQNLGMGFTEVAIYNGGLSAVRVLTAGMWGRVIDRFGVRPVLTACSLGIVTVPVLWLFPTAGHAWPYLGADILLSGVLWSGHALATFSLPFVSAPRASRPFYLAAFSTAAGFTFALFATLGGWLLPRLPEHVSVLGRPLLNFHLLFLASAALRLGATLLSLRLHEPKAQGVPAMVRWMQRAATARVWEGTVAVASPVLRLLPGAERRS